MNSPRSAAPPPAEAVTPWWEAEVEVPEELADDAAAALIEAGAGGVETLDAGTVVPPGARGPSRRTPKAGHALLVATFAPEDFGEDDDPAELVREALAQVAPPLRGAAVSTARRADADWTQHWKTFFEPLAIGAHFWVVPPWHAEAGFKAPSGAHTILIDPGMAFGTGQHATTALCLELLEELAPLDRSVLDVGTGSGILALGAALLGATRVLGTDNDDVALRFAGENVARHPAVASRIALSGEDVATLPGTFDVVVANILAHTLIELAPAIAAKVTRGGSLVLSGILAPDGDAVVTAYEAATRGALRQVRRLQRGEWVAILLGSSPSGAGS